MDPETRGGRMSSKGEEAVERIRRALPPDRDRGSGSARSGDDPGGIFRYAESRRAGTLSCCHRVHLVQSTMASPQVLAQVALGFQRPMAPAALGVAVGFQRPASALGGHDRRQGICDRRRRAKGIRLHHTHGWSRRARVESDSETPRRVLVQPRKACQERIDSSDWRQESSSHGRGIRQARPHGGYRDLQRQGRWGMARSKRARHRGIRRQV